MTPLSLQAGTALDNLRQLAKEWKTTLEEDCQRFCISIPRRLGEGDVIAYAVSEGIDTFIVDGRFKKELRINITYDSVPPIAFYTLVRGSFHFVNPAKEERNFELEPLQSTIHSSRRAHTCSWTFPPRKDLLFCCLLVHKEPFFREIDCAQLDIPADLLEVVKDIEGQTDFLFQDIYHLPAVTAVKDIIAQEDIGLLNSTFAAAKTYEILFLQLRAYQEHGKGENGNGHGHPVREEAQRERIRQAEELLVGRLMNPPNIPELARMVGINQQALKRGFKQLYGQTINQYLNDKRLDQAEILIQAGELSFQDIALEVGYSNPSYFSRRFKRKYGVSPRYYARQLAKIEAGDQEE